MADQKHDKMADIIALAKRRGFIFQGSEIYGGLAGTWDYGPYGVTLKNNIKHLWWRTFVESRDDMHGIDAAILMNEKVWEASGHTGAGFSDPLVECSECHKRFRADKLENRQECPECGGSFGEERDFNLMFETKVGAQGEMKSYLRPETAQGIFVNFKNVIDSLHPKMPFGIGQIGKAFRNEISPREFLFRTREFEQMEIEYFVKEDEWETQFENWRMAMWGWIDALGIDRKNVQELDVPKDELAHYSKRTIDFEYNFPGKGFDELYGLAYRTDHDLKNHAEKSGVDISYTDADGSKYIPHVIEPTFGVDRTVMAVLAEHYTEDELNGETRTFLKFPPHLAPVKAAVSPLLKNKPELVEKAREVYTELKTHIPQIMWDDHGNIGKRYRRQDEIGTPFCITVDFDSLEKEDVTVRDRNTGDQERVGIAELVSYLSERLRV